MRAEHEARISLAWHTVMFDRQKRLEPLHVYLGKPPPKTRPKTADELLAVMRQWADVTQGLEAQAKRKPHPGAA